MARSFNQNPLNLSLIEVVEMVWPSPAYVRTLRLTVHTVCINTPFICQYNQYKYLYLSIKLVQIRPLSVHKISINTSFICPYSQYKYDLSLNKRMCAPMYNPLFQLIIYGLNSLNYSIRTRLWYANFTEQSELTAYNIFVDSLRIYTVMSWINFIFIISSGLELFSTFKSITLRCLIYVLFNLTNLSTIVNCTFAGPVASWQTPSSREKSKLIFKKLLKKPTTRFYIGDDY